MRFLANENFPGDAVAELRAGGHDVVWIRTDAPGMADPDILTWAVGENRNLLAFDKDFGELAFKEGLPASCGVVLFRLALESPVDVGKHLAARFAERADRGGHFSVIEQGRIRMRPL